MFIRIAETIIFIAFIAVISAIFITLCAIGYDVPTEVICPIFVVVHIIATPMILIVNIIATQPVLDV